jgi:hypothetical protein
MHIRQETAFLYSNAQAPYARSVQEQVAVQEPMRGNAIEQGSGDTVTAYAAKITNSTTECQNNTTAMKSIPNV